MKTLKILIRLHKKQLDDLLKKINNLEEQKNNLTKTLAFLEEQAKKEHLIQLNKLIENLQKENKELKQIVFDVYAGLSKFENDILELSDCSESDCSDTSDDEDLENTTTETENKKE